MNDSSQVMCPKGHVAAPGQAFCATCGTQLEIRLKQPAPLRIQDLAKRCRATTWLWISILLMALAVFAFLYGFVLSDRSQAVDYADYCSILDSYAGYCDPVDPSNAFPTGSFVVGFIASITGLGALYLRRISLTPT